MADKDRVFLVVVDESPEMRNALHYACRRAKRTGGRVALLYVMPP
ncbi:MAG TPA: universal stress protein, partial [Acetobacteraceae bacterium]|nr:universal stress protein [Acetobacteraceae bacterium]